MANQQLHIPFETLVDMLHRNGFNEIGTAAVLDMQKVLYGMQGAGAEDLALLKFRLSPIVCRNKEDQEKFYTVFNEFTTFVSRFAEAKKQASEKEKGLRKHRKYLLIGSFFLAVLTIVLIYFFQRNNSGKDRSPYKPQIGIEHTNISFPNNPEIAIRDTVEYRAKIIDTSGNEKRYRIDWEVNDSIIPDTPRLLQVYNDTATKKVRAHLMAANGTVISSSDVYLIPVKCEHTPELEINKKEKGNEKIYEPVISNASDTSRYRYSWFIKDSLASQKRMFSTRYFSDTPYTVKAVVDLNGLHCTTNSLTASYNESPNFELQAQGMQPIKLLPASRRFNALPLIGLLMTLALLGWLLWYRLKKIDLRKNKQDDESTLPVEAKTNEGNHKIVFREQNMKLGRMEEVDRFADRLRKRQASDTLLLNMKETIKKTVRSFGLPTMVFSQRTAALEYLLLIDKGRPESHLSQLFELLATYIRQSEVDVVTYEYYKEPLRLNNKEFNHVQIPLDQVNQIYHERVLFLFTDGEELFESLKAELKAWVKEKFKNRTHKILVTPKPRKDWGYKELLLKEAGFVVLPADIYQESILESVIHAVHNAVTDAPAKEQIEQSGISLRDYDFNDFKGLQKYFKEEEDVLQWVCATALYPRTDWKITLAIGIALEEKLRKTNPEQVLVSYAHLLKIARIKWMNGRMPSETLRSRMINYLDQTTEATARQAIINLLDEIKPAVPKSSYAYEELNLQDNVNRLLVGLLQNKEVEDAVKLSVKEYLDKSYLDWTLQKRLQDERNSPVLRNSQTISIQTYLNEFAADSLTQKEKEITERKKKIRWRNTILVTLFVLLTAAAGWIVNKENLFFTTVSAPAQIEFILLQKQSGAGWDSVSLTVDTVSYAAEKINDSVYRFKRLYLRDTTSTAGLHVYNTSSSALSLQTDLYKEITLNSASFKITVIPVKKKPLRLYYNNRAVAKTVGILKQYLSYRFQVDTIFSQATDTTLIRVYVQNAEDRVNYIKEVITPFLTRAGTVASQTGTLPPEPYNTDLIELYWNQMPLPSNDGLIEAIFIQVNDVYEIMLSGNQGGLARVATLKKQYRRQNPNSFMVMAGDFLSPSLFNNLKYKDKRIRGRQMIDVMNEAGVDFSIFGHHEFDLNESELQERINESNFQWIASNVFYKQPFRTGPFSRTNGTTLPKTFILTILDQDSTTARIGFLGLTLPFNQADYVSYTDPLSTAKQLYNQIKDSCDAVVAITHQSMEDDINLARQLPGLAAILGGHEHDMRYTKVGNVTITKALANARSAFVVRLLIDKKTKTVTAYPQNIVMDRSITPERNTEQVARSWMDIAYKIYEPMGFEANKILLPSGKPLDGRESVVRFEPTNLTRLITAAMSNAVPDADVVLFNAGSIRVDDLLVPPISVYDILKTLPYGGGIAQAKMKGSLLIKVLDAGRRNKGSGGFLHYDDHLIYKEKIGWLLQGKVIDPEYVYHVAVSEILLTGGEVNLDFLNLNSPGIESVYPANNDSYSSTYDIRIAIIKYLENNPTLQTK